MVRKSLLAGTAIAGMTLGAAGSLAGTAEVGDSFTVTISGGYRFSVLVFEQEQRLVGNGQGYRFASDEAEVKFAAGGVADNGLEYGFEMELQTQTDDGANADETWAYLRGNWGEINLGDQDDAADRMAIGGEDAMPGRGGYDGAIGDVFNLSGAAFNGPSASFTGDATKITYFSPRFFGLQVGASWTPDSNHDGGSPPSDADTAFVSVASAGINYSEDFNGFGVIVAGTLVWADETEVVGLAPSPTVAQSFDDAWQYQVGALLSYAGFQLGAAYGGGHNLFPFTATGVPGDLVDAGWWADVGVSYSTGPWKFGGGYFFSSAENDGLGVSGPETEVQIFSVGANYQVAPGMALATDVNFVEADNPSGAIPALGGVPVDNEGTVFVFSTIFSF
jgi:outer membrane protein OmpU